jgi:glycosyltransferase involved in cell wall biosynthesis
VKAKFVSIDPEFPQWIRWMESVPFLRTLVRTPLYTARLWRELGDMDVAHIFSASYWSFWLAPVPAWAIARLRGKKTIVNYHSGEAQDHLSKSGMAQAALRGMGMKVVPSAYLQQVFREFGMDAEVIPNLMDVEQIPYRERSKVKPVLICTRGCEPYYAIDDVLRAFGLVQAEHTQAQLILVGGGSLEAEMRELASELGLRNVEFAGRVRQEEIGAYYDRADIFVNASVVDNMPMSLMEAFAAGLPVVSTATGGICYMVEHERSGLLSPPRDWRQLGNNILRALREPGLAATLARNARREAQEYRWEIVREQWLHLYQSVARGERQVKEQTVEPQPLGTEVK